MSRIPHKAGRVPYSGVTHAPYDLPEYRGGGADGGSAEPTYAIWNAADMATAYVLAVDNRQITHTTDAGSWRLGRVTIGKSTGEWQASIVIEDAASGNIIIGVSKAAASVNSFLGADTNGYGYHMNGQKFNAGSGSAYGTAYNLSSVITIRYNADTGDLEFKNNGTSQGVIATGLTGEVFITFSSYDANARGLLFAGGDNAVAFPFPGINQGWFTS